MQITSWQGDGLVVDALEQTGEGEYRTTEPIPVHGDWKALLRIHDGRMLTAVPIYLPEDEALGEEIPAEDGMTRGAIPEIEILQRELQVLRRRAVGCGEPRRPGLHAGADRRHLLGRRPVLPPGQRPGALPRHPGRRADDGRDPGRQRPRRPLIPASTAVRVLPRFPAALVGLTLAAGLAGCAGTDAPEPPRPRRRPSTASPSATSAATSPAGQRIEVQLDRRPGHRRHRPGAGGRRASTVTLVITSDVADEVHVHGYDLEAALSPGQPAELTFDATIPGVFEVELHEAGTLLLTLQVG